MSPYSLLYFLFFLQSNAQIPKECGTNYTLKTGVCCPLSTFNQQPCGFPEKGICQEVEVHETEVEKFGFDDVRFQWPKRWFEYLCKCNGNYFGASCDECWYGWEGEKCSKKKLIIRRNILGYSKEEKKQFVKVLKSLREKDSGYLLIKEAYGDMKETIVPCNIYEMIVNIHFFAQRSILTKNEEICQETPHFDFAHGSVGFITFHRHLMLLWEKWSAKVAKDLYAIDNFSFPYWDWTDKKDCEVCTNDLIGNTGELSEEGTFYINEGSPFNHWKVYCDLYSPKTRFSINSCATCSYSSQSSKLTRKIISSFPLSEHVKFTLSRPFYASTISSSNAESECQSFTKALEGVCGRKEWNLKNTMHNAVHSNIVGPFSESSTSPNDPLFILHHTQVDRLFQLWWLSKPASSKIYPESVTPGHCFLCNHVGFIPIVTHKQLFLDCKNIGYDYDSFQFGNK